MNVKHILDNAPDGSQRYNCGLSNKYMRKTIRGVDYYHDVTGWSAYRCIEVGERHWNEAVTLESLKSQLVDSEPRMERDDNRRWYLHGDFETAHNEGVLINNGWTFEQIITFGTPLISGPTPTATNTVDQTVTERGERYGKFKDGSKIMQDLKNVMRDAPNWEGLSPSQREALEMIQHKIGRILNGDPDYDDNWRDICGYSQLVLDELNGTVR